MLAVFHEIRSLHNVGSMFRTADAAGLTKIYLSGITPGPVDAFGRPEIKFTKVSLGAENYLAWGKVSSTVALLAKLKKSGHVIVAVEQSPNSIPYHQVKFTKKQLAKVVLVVGHEVNGLSEEILQLADYILEIPMLGQKESLNVSVAFGIVSFHLFISSLVE